MAETKVRCWMRGWLACLSEARRARLACLEAILFVYGEWREWYGASMELLDVCQWLVVLRRFG